MTGDTIAIDNDGFYHPSSEEEIVARTPLVRAKTTRLPRNTTCRPRTHPAVCSGRRLSGAYGCQSRPA